LVAFCLTQPTSTRVKNWAESFSIAVWWAAHTEIHSAIARLYRLKELPKATRLVAIERLEVLREEWDQVDPSEAVRHQAASVLDLYPLRAADSLQLAAALIWCRNRPAGRTFICADDRLCDAATQAGFTVLRP
jgi:uncharacterized protein